MLGVSCFKCVFCQPDVGVLVLCVVFSYCGFVDDALLEALSFQGALVRCSTVAGTTIICDVAVFRCSFV